MYQNSQQTPGTVDTKTSTSGNTIIKTLKTKQNKKTAKINKLNK